MSYELIGKGKGKELIHRSDNDELTNQFETTSIKFDDGGGDYDGADCITERSDLVSDIVSDLVSDLASNLVSDNDSHNISNLSNVVQCGSMFVDKDSFDSLDVEVNEHANAGLHYSNSHVFVNNCNHFPMAKVIGSTTKNYAQNTRKVPRRNKIIAGCTLALSIALTVLWFYRLVSFSLDSVLYNLSWIPLTLLCIFILLFPIHIVTSGSANIFGSTEFFFTNSKYYSCTVEPVDIEIMNNINNITENKDVTVTIQIPIYKEDFDTVIKPTLKSAMLCRKYYDCHPEHNITVNIFVNDDGLQVIDDADVQKRISFYNKYNIGYTARPRFGRAGKFKKASNMNFGLEVSRLFMKYNKQFTKKESLVLTRFNYEENNIHTLIGNDISIGDYILLLDSDTRIPINCLHNVVREFILYPTLGYTQHLVYPMVVTNTYWERFIAHFTTLIYDLAIPISVAGGDVSPLVGHCAVLRSSALWKLSVDEDGKPRKIWSENNVSEDFKLFMDLTSHGYYGRYITYTSNVETEYFEKHNFMEGISLEYIDELAKFKKYGYGTCEMLFNPFKDWCKLGPIGKPIIEYCSSNVEFTSKLGIVSYLFTYIAISLGLPLSYINYFLYGWFPEYIDTKIPPVYIAIQVSLLFSGLGTLANSLFKARILRKDAVNVLWYNLLQIPFYFLFFGSLSYHLVHMMVEFFIGRENISWGSTRKEISYFSQKDAFISTIMDFKYMYTFFTLTIIMVIILNSSAVPEKWRITDYQAMYPILTTCVAHIIGPIVLNPYIMTNNKLKKLAENRIGQKNHDIDIDIANEQNNINLFLDT